MYRMIRGKVRSGDKAPAINAIDIDGDRFDLSGHTGKNNLLIFFYRTVSCSTCRDELKELRDNYDDIKGQGCEIVAISTDSPGDAKQMAGELDLPFRLISDEAGRIIQDYGVYDKNTDTAFITLFLVDMNGIVRHIRPVEGMEDKFHAGELIDRLRSIRGQF
ncbi:peroxiredoxin [Methanocella sp. CWC-04]|uniref:Peroxiredoxin n=1 Tax=Methanooceanicella nereidis TaxID=2052831 RepID=A0AAP2REY9_9EURY|nr:peroxiredoxin family protein [Methanocella sp. CWC-04]MCD1294850.1 peroxiredoxin [Methanocella sp. CWC-04]